MELNLHYGGVHYVELISLFLLTVLFALIVDLPEHWRGMGKEKIRFKMLRTVIMEELLILNGGWCSQEEYEITVRKVKGSVFLMGYEHQKMNAIQCFMHSWLKPSTILELDDEKEIVYPLVSAVVDRLRELSQQFNLDLGYTLTEFAAGFDEVMSKQVNVSYIAKSNNLIT